MHFPNLFIFIYFYPVLMFFEKETSLAPSGCFAYECSSHRTLEKKNPHPFIDDSYFQT
jgi:hypothetical protein